MLNYTCPKCFKRQMVGQYKYLCGNEECAKCRDMQQAAVGTGPFFRAPECSECGRNLTVRVCPGCGYELPMGIGSGKDCPISLIGAEGVGKSNYLAVLINQMKNEVGKAFGCTLHAQGGDATINRYLSTYYNPLYVDKRCVSSTVEEDVEPLHYSMIFSDRDRGRTGNLTFYDTCGANFENVRQMEKFNRSIYNSKGLLFLIDPMELPQIRERLVIDGETYTPKISSGDILTRTIHLIREGMGLRRVSRKIPIPIAICLTKIDKLGSYLDVSSCLRYPSRVLEGKGIDPMDFHNNSLEIQSMLESWSDRQLINQITSQFEQYAFFGLSSLGSSPKADNAILKLSPFRTADPLLWLLWVNGILHV